jgi:hypothetical protein
MDLLQDAVNLFIGKRIASSKKTMKKFKQKQKNERIQ